MGSAGKSCDNITKEFLVKALKNEGKYDAEILSFKTDMGSKPGDNYTSLIYTIDVELKDRKTGKEIPKRSLLIKCNPNHRERQEFANRSNLFYKELKVYAQWIPELYRMQTEVLKFSEDEMVKLPYPKFIHGESIDFESDEGKVLTGRELSPLESFVMMEDIRKMYGFTTTNRRETFDIHHMLLVIKALANVHSMSWAYRQHVEPNITSKLSCLVPNFAQDDIDMWNSIVRGNLKRAIAILDEELGEGNELSKASARFSNLLERCFEFFMGRTGDEVAKDILRVEPDPKKYGRSEDFQEQPWRIIAHGDCWSNNMMFRYDEKSGIPVEIVLLDLQFPNEGCVVKDLEYVFHTSTDAAFRKAHLDSLLHLYHDEFNKNCKKLRVDTLPGFSVGELKYRFQRAKFMGFYMASMGMPIMLKEQDKVMDMEEMDKDTDLEKMFNDVCDGTDNPVYRKRMMEITREMYEQGVI